MNKVDQEKEPNNSRLIKITVIGTVIFIIVNLIIQFFLREDPLPASEYQFTNRDNSTSEFLNVVFTGEEIPVPEEMPIAQPTSSRSEEDVINSLITNLNLTPHPEADTIWQSNEWYLNYQPTADLYILLNLEASSEEHAHDLTAGMSETLLIEAAREGINQFLPGANVEPQLSNIIYLLDEHEYLAPTTSDQARLGVIQFSYNIEGYPVFYDKTAQPPFEITVNSEYELLKMTFYPGVNQPVVIDQKDTITIEEALENIQEKSLASIISYGQEQGNPLMIESILSADFQTVTLEYRLDPNLNLFYPFYRFIGEAETENDTLFVDVITPAIQVRL